MNFSKELFDAIIVAKKSYGSNNEILQRPF